MELSLLRSMGVILLCGIVEVTELREGGDVRGRSLTAIMILDYNHKMHTYLRYA